MRGGEHKEKGLILRCFEEIMKKTEEKGGIFIEVLVLFKENTFDLLSEETLELRESRNIRKTRVSNLNEVKNVWDLSNFRLNSLSSQLNEPNLKEKAVLSFSFINGEDFMSKFTIFRLGDLSEQSPEAKSLRKFLNNTSNKAQDQESILTYKLANENYMKLGLLTVISPQSPLENIRFYLDFTQKIATSGPKILKPPKSPTYNNEFLRKTPETQAFSKEKLKENDFDRDFTNLIDRYKRSKLLIDSLPRKNNEKTAIFNKTIGPLANIEQDIMKLKSHIAEKLENSAKKNDFQQKNKKFEGFNEKNLYPETTKGSLKQLKGAFMEKEAILTEKVETLRRNNEDLKENLREYMEKKDELERENREREELLDEFGEKARELEKGLLEEREISREIKEKYEEIRREKEGLLARNEEIERKYEKKAQKVNSLK